MVRDFLIDRFGYWALQLLAQWFQRLPLERALALGRWAGELAYLLNPRRRVAYVNLKTAFPNSTVRDRKRWTREMFQHFGMTGVEILRFPILKAAELQRLMSTPGYEEYLLLRRKETGLLLLTAHLGNWELAQVMEGVRGRPMTVIARRQKHRRLDRFLNSFREYFGSVSVEKGGGIRDIIRTLRAGGCVGLLGDQSGGPEGVWVRFFGRLTTAPRGAMTLALKLDLTVLPVFCVRSQGPFHTTFFGPPLLLVRTGNLQRDVQVNSQRYIELLESYLSKYPSQWLWAHKRWKHTRTKRVTLLSDGKRGHVKQSETLVKEIVRKGNEKGPPYETPVEKIEVRFRSEFRRLLFPLFALFLIPWAQGRLRWLRFFLAPACWAKIETTNPDVIVSAGAALVPLNLLLSRENLAKSVVLMKPGFPFNLFHYDLAVIPAHDRGLLPAEHLRIQGVLSGIDLETLETSRRALAPSLRDAERVKLSLFLGGRTRGFRLSLAEVETLFEELERTSERLDGDYVVTTSRRTPESVNHFVENWMREHPRCQLAVIAARDSRPEVVPGMMALADWLLVTEDSLSMISEALSSGKRVVVVKMAGNGLPRKHDRFQESLRREWGVPVVEVRKLSGFLAKGETLSPREPFQEERMRLREALETLF